jgi:cyclopropane-fatty-acyl-phospholipid synthase
MRSPTSPAITLKVSGASALKDLANPDPRHARRGVRRRTDRCRRPIDEALRTAEALSRYLGEAKDGKRPAFWNVHSKKRDSKVIRYHYRRLERFLRAVARPAPGVLVRILQDRRRKPGKAQKQKLDHICSKLRLSPGERFLTSAAAGARS